jgi:hypothetical protein
LAYACNRTFELLPPSIHKSKAKLEDQSSLAMIVSEEPPYIPQIWLLGCRVGNIGLVWHAFEVNNFQVQVMKHDLLAVLRPWSELIVHDDIGPEECPTSQLLETLLLLKEHLKELFSIRRQVFNAPILIPRLFCFQEEFLWKGFK